VGEAVFELVRNVEPAEAYDAVSGLSTLHARLEGGNGRTSVDSLLDLTRWAGERGVDLAGAVSKAPDVFAQFVAALELDVRALLTPELYSFVEERFPVQLDQELPRVEDGRLLFVGAAFELNEEPKIWRVSADLANGDVHQEPVPPRPETSEH
jgi:hypothetical protein